MACRNKITLVLMAAAFIAPAFAAPPQLGWRLDGDAFLRFGQGIETPHTDWAKPAATGKIRALIIANRSGAYDVPQLAQRFDLDVKGMPADSWLHLGDWYWLALWIESSSSAERLVHLERMLEDEYDVIVLANFRLLSLSEAAQYAILKKVTNGCGLVVFHRHDLDPRLLRQPVPEAAETLSRGLPFAGLDFYRDWFMPSRDLIASKQIGDQLFHGYTFGAGRVLIVDYNSQSSVFAATSGAIVPPMQYDYTAPVRYDYHQAIACRCLQWAARRDPRLAWMADLPDGMEIPAMAVAQSVSIRAIWSGPDGTRLTRKTRIRNLWGELLLDDSEAIAANPGPLAWTLSLPPLPGGWHFVDCIISSPQGVENFASFAVDVRPAIRIDAVEPADSFFEPGQPIKGRVVLSRPPTAADRASLDITLEDGYGRVFSKTVQPIDAGQDRVAFEIAQGHAVSWGARVRVRLNVGGRTVHQDEAEVRIRRPNRGEYPIAMWGATSGYGNHLGNLQMKSLGFTAVIGDPLVEARDDLGWMTFGGGRGALIHSLGDEIPIPRAAKGDAFAAFLKKRYASVDAMNAAWGTKFESFEAAEPLRTSANVKTVGDLTSVARTSANEEAGSFVRTHDSLSCGEFQFAEMIRKRREKIEQENPTGVVGPEGSPVGDPELTLPQATFWGPYLADRDNLLVSALASPSVLRGNWFGGYVEDRQIPTRNRHRLWMSILGGNNMIEYFTIEGGLLAPDLTLMPFVHEFLPSWQEIRRGLGPQLATCRPTSNPIALLHSQPSEHVGSSGDDSTDTIKGHEYVLGLLGDAGFSPRYVASGQVKAGGLTRDGIKVLLLVQAYALSDDEIAKIREFVDGGGTVIADIPPAWFDERCQIRKLRGMDEFFGIRPEAPAPSLRPHMQRMASASTLTFGYGPMLLRGVRPSDEPGNIYVRSHGRGRSILLDAVLWREGREDPRTIQSWRKMLTEAGVRPTFDLVYRQPLRKVGTRVYSYQRGDIHIDAVLPPEATDAAIPVKPSLTWNDTKHTYDLRTAKYLGHVNSVEQEIDRSSPVVLARLDYQVAAVKIEAGKSAPIGGKVEMTCGVYDTQGKPRPGHVLRVAVFGPDGKERPYYGAWLSGDGPRQSWRIPLALNDPTGKWKLTVADVISGITAETGFEVRE